jgi:hypothetical protein
MRANYGTGYLALTHGPPHTASRPVVRSMDMAVVIPHEMRLLGPGGELSRTASCIWLALIAQSVLSRTPPRCIENSPPQNEISGNTVPRYLPSHLIRANQLPAHGLSFKSVPINSTKTPPSPIPSSLFPFFLHTLPSSTTRTPSIRLHTRSHIGPYLSPSLQS